MNDLIASFLQQGVFAFLLTFVRIGTAIMLMPGVGDSMTPANVRLYFALALSVIATPMVADVLPHTIPGAAAMLLLIGKEFVIGAFIGTIMRIFLAALDTAGMLISVSSGLGSAQLFNPSFATQGSLISSFLTLSGVLFLFATNMHHLMFEAIFGSYNVFPVGALPDSGSMASMIQRVVSGSFLIAFQLSAPFIVITLMFYICMGVIARLMPAIQVFQLALPAQILLSLSAFMLCVSSLMLFWTQKFQDGMTFFLLDGG